MTTIKTLQNEIFMLQEEIQSLTIAIGQSPSSITTFWVKSEELVQKKMLLAAALLNHSVVIGGEEYTLFGLQTKIEHLQMLLEELFESGATNLSFFESLKKDLLEVSQEVDLYYFVA